MTAKCALAQLQWHSTGGWGARLFPADLGRFVIHQEWQSALRCHVATGCDRQHAAAPAVTGSVKGTKFAQERRGPQRFLL